ERRVDILGHALLVTAHVEMRAILKPFLQLRAPFPQAMLNIDLLRLIARECNFNSREIAGRQIILPLELIEEIVGEVAFAEEEPALALRSGSHALFDERTIGRDASPSADHDDRRMAIGRQ